MKVFIPLLSIVSIIFLNSCSAYESDARKYLRERGFELTNSVKNNKVQLAEQHCFQVALNTAEPEWENLETPEKHIIRYYDASFSCTFERTKPKTWKEAELILIEEIVNHYSSNF